MWRRLSSNLIRSLVPLAILLAALAAWRAAVLPAPAERVLTDISNEGQNAQGLVLLTRNYYEELINVDRGQWRGGPGYQFAIGLLKGKQAAEDAAVDKGNWVRLGASGAVRQLEGYLEYELLPNVDMTFMGARLTTNRWGQRDSDCELTKPPKTFRIALVGTSNDMGYGVEFDDMYAEILEKRLNSELAGGAYDRFEVINFSVGGYEMLDRMYVAAEKVPPFDPDLILVVMTMHDLRWAIRDSIVARLIKHIDLRFDNLKAVVAKAGVRGDESALRIQRKLKPFEEPLTTACFLDLKALSERLHTPLATIVLRLRVEALHESTTRQADLSQNAGLITLRIFDSYEGQSPEEMYLSKTDYHPTAKGHRLIADELYAKMLGQPEIRRMLIPEAASTEK